MSDYDNEINPGMPEKMGKDIKIPKSWKELESENAQLRADLVNRQDEVERLADTIACDFAELARLRAELEEARYFRSNYLNAAHREEKP
jgi:septal ring factor EnvC (AmiA/AmiB activator)